MHVGYPLWAQGLYKYIYFPKLNFASPDNLSTFWDEKPQSTHNLNKPLDCVSRSDINL